MQTNNPGRRRRRATLAIAAALASAALALSGCSGGSSPGPSEGGEKSTLTIAMSSPPVSLDPSKGAGAGSTFQLVAYQGLLTAGAPGEDPKPSLAESYEWVGDGPEVTLQMKLREGLKFSDGTVMDSAAVKTSIEHFASAGGGQSYVAAPISSMETPDDLTIVFHLSQPTPTFLSDLTEGQGMGSIINPKVIADDPESLGTSTAGAGPYVLTKTGTVEGSEYHYVPNEHYFDPEAILYKDVVIKVIADPNTALASLQAGQIDVSYGFPDAYERTTSAGVDATMFSVTVNGLWLQDWEGRVVPALKDVRVRQAINFALDREAISKADTLGLGIATAQAPPADTLGYDAQLDDTYGYDPKKASELLEEAGFADGFDLPVIIPGFMPTASTVAEAAAAQLAKVGINLQITKATTFPEYAQGQESGTYAATVFPLSYTAGMPSVVGFLYTPQALINPMRVELPDVLASAGEAGAATGEVSQDAWAAVNELAVEQAYSAPITTEPIIWYSDKSVSDIGESFVLNPANITPASD